MSIRNRKILIDSAGGLYKHEELGKWIFASDYINGIVSDLLVVDIVSPIVDMLSIVGCHTYTTRECNRAAGVGESGQPRWHEGAVPYLQANKVPSAIWSIGENNLEKDTLARGAYADYIKVDCIVSITFSNSAEQGMEFYYNTPEAKQLAESIRDSLCSIDHKGMREKFIRRDPENQFPIVNNATIPAVRVSLFNLRNASEAWLSNQWWSKIKTATGVFGGIYKMFEK